MRYIRRNLKLFKNIFIILVIIIFLVVKVKLVKASDGVVEKEEVIVKEEITEEVKEEIKEEVVTNVKVDIKGEVVKQGVYELSIDSRVIDVVNKASGLTKNADTSLINLAKKIKDEMVIIIYSKEEVKKSKEDNVIVQVIEKECDCPIVNNDACISNDDNKNNDNKNDDSQSSGNTNNNDVNEKINLNTCTLEDILKVPGLGEKKAQAILEYRNDFGFRELDDLLNISGIGESTYEKIKDYFTL